jgi:hypothetical protein
VGCWLFNEGGGNSFYDVVTQKRSTVSGTITRSADGINLDGSSYLQNSGPSSYNNPPLTIFTVGEFSTASAVSTICSGGNNSDGGWAYKFEMYNNTGKMGVTKSASGDYQFSAIASPSSKSSMAVVVKGLVASGYLNGVFLQDVSMSSWNNIVSGTFNIGASYPLNDNVTGKMYLMFRYNRALSPSEIASLHANPYQIFSRNLWVGGTAEVGGNVTSEATPGSYTLTGFSATSTRQLLSNASAGSYTLTGTAATSTRQLLSNAAAGSYTLTGVAATSLRALVSSASPGSYTLTGYDATSTVSEAGDTVSIAEAGSYTLTGFATSDIRALLSDASPGAYTLTGYVATGYKSIQSNADAGSYTLTGVSATSRKTAYISGATPGSYILTGFSATSSGPATAGVVIATEYAPSRSYIEYAPSRTFTEYARSVR